MANRQRRKPIRRRLNLTRHHIIPTSRGGQDSPRNVLWVDEKYHRAWHLLFRNMKPEEAISHIKRNWSYGTLLKDEDNLNLTRHHIIPTSRGGGSDPINILWIKSNYHRAWHLLFGNMTSEEAVSHIKRNWSYRRILVSKKIAKKAARKNHRKAAGRKNGQNIDAILINLGFVPERFRRPQRLFRRESAYIGR